MNSRRLVLCGSLLYAIWTGGAQSASSWSFRPVDTTPYDSQMERIEKFIQMHANEAGDDIPTVEQVNRWLRHLHSVRYEYSRHWKTPAEMQLSRSGDCKSKAVGLYYLMRSYGARNVMLIVGRRTETSADTHAWLLWQAHGRTYILDPTNETECLDVTNTEHRQYLPHYAYCAGKKYRPGPG